MTLTLTDLFAGFGGASSGAVTVPGVELVMAANHWPLAVEVHNSNHPDADHACVDLHLEDPAYFPSTDLLWASPECTQWSQANGKKPDLAPILGGWSLFDDLDEDLKLSEDAATKSRLMMFDVLRFIEHHRYRAGVVENVVDIARNPKYAAPWRAWQTGLVNLGYGYRVVSLNSMHAQALGDPAPQSRDRIYVVFWRLDQREPDVSAFMRPRGWCARCDAVVESFQAWKPGRTVGKYRQQYVYCCTTPGCGQVVEPGWLPAAAAIDWTLAGTRIGDRTKPLAEKTRARIAAGIARYWAPVHVEMGNTFDATNPRNSGYGDPNGYYRAWPVDEVLRTLHTGESKALAVPFVLDNNHQNRGRSVGEVLPTQTTATTKALVQPFIAELRGGGSTARSTGDPLATVTASGNHHALVTRYNSAKGGNPARHTTPADEYLRTLTAEGPIPALLAPYYGTADTSQSVDTPIGTLTTRDRYALIMRNNSSKGAGSEMVTPAGEYLRTLTTTGHESVLTPGDIAAAEAQVDDCLFRMLEPHEVGAGMAFAADYKVLGTRREQVKGYGNAVTPPAARDLIGAVAASLGGAAA